MVTGEHNAAMLFLQLERVITARENFRKEYDAFQDAYLTCGGAHQAYVDGFASMMNAANRSGWSDAMRGYLGDEGMVLPPPI